MQHVSASITLVKRNHPAYLFLSNESADFLLGLHSFCLDRRNTTYCYLSVGERYHTPYLISADCSSLVGSPILGIAIVRLRTRVQVIHILSTITLRRAIFWGCLLLSYRGLTESVLDCLRSSDSTLSIFWHCKKGICGIWLGQNGCCQKVSVVLGWSFSQFC